MVFFAHRVVKGFASVALEVLGRVFILSCQQLEGIHCICPLCNGRPAM
jgi:hypothetical protein